jgi:hypothetical protein
MCAAEGGKRGERELRVLVGDLARLGTESRVPASPQALHGPRTRSEHRHNPRTAGRPIPSGYCLSAETLALSRRATEA